MDKYGIYEVRMVDADDNEVACSKRFSVFDDALLLMTDWVLSAPLSSTLGFDLVDLGQPAPLVRWRDWSYYQSS